MEKIAIDGLKAIAGHSGVDGWGDRFENSMKPYVEAMLRDSEESKVRDKEMHFANKNARN